MDPEHPQTLEQLRVLQISQVAVNTKTRLVEVSFTPTIPHCSSASMIGLMIHVKLIRSLPNNYKIEVQIEKGSHNQEDMINKQLKDKERISAALENIHIMAAIRKGIHKTDDLSMYQF